MTIYMTKVYGFDVPHGPLEFGIRGNMERAIEMLKPGDRVGLVTTLEPPTPDGMRGLMLGMVEPTTQVVSSLDYNLPRQAHHLDDAGKYKWPYALVTRRAWRFPRRPEFTEISKRRFRLDAAASIVPLEPDEAAKVETEATEEVPLLPRRRPAAPLDGHPDQRGEGPPPATTTRRGVMHMRRAPAFTYAFRLIGADNWAVKFGWAFDFRQRMRLFNQQSLPSLGGIEYRPVFFARWPSARHAYLVERQLLLHFQQRRHPKNREVVVGVDDDELNEIWHHYAGTGGRRG